MKKIINYNDGELIIKYKFTDEHLKTLFLIKANDSVVAFENRDLTCEDDLDHNGINWQICDELVEMGLLCENEESFTVEYELISEGEIAIDIVSNNL
jgi:hypothetical protein